MDRRRYELSALEVFEVGKPWAEADGDIREAMDFCRFYAATNAADRATAANAACSRRRKLSALLAARRRSGDCAVEFSDRHSLRNGFRSAGHWQYGDYEAVGAVHHLRRDADGDFRGSWRPARGLNFYRAAVRSSARTLSITKIVDLIAFTGSREVGLRIWESAGITRPGQRELKRVVCEMGGKNRGNHRF